MAEKKTEPTYKFVAECKFCGTSICSDHKIGTCDACGSTDVVCYTLKQFEAKKHKEDAYEFTSAKTIAKTTKKKKNVFRHKLKFKFNAAKATKIAIIVGYIVATIVTIATCIF